MADGICLMLDMQNLEVNRRLYVANHCRQSYKYSAVTRDEDNPACRGTDGRYQTASQHPFFDLFFLMTTD
jgi:hypothetical protein